MKNFILILGILATILVAGSFDYTEEVVYSMPTSTYRCMKANGWTDKEIAKEYQRNKAHWNKEGERYELENGCDD
jgi:hypothetical protein